MRKVLTLFIALCCITTAQAQLADGSYAPNFTGTDIDGNTWTLYDILDSGKSVVLDVSATWCGPCWNYHQTGALENVYEAYGPGGSDEMMVLWVEGDPATTLADIQGTGDNTVGDWTNGVYYPIIDDSSIGDIYEITYFPTIYFICPNRTVVETGALSASELYALNDNCQIAAGTNNLGILSYSGFDGGFCQSISFEPSAFFQNLGTENVAAATFELSVNGMSTETIEWTGDIATYEAETITFSSITATATTDISINVISVNGMTDEDASNNLITAQVTATQSNSNLYTLSLTTDNYPTETYWELLDENGETVHTGGNSNFFDGMATPSAGAYTEPFITYTESLLLENDGCFDFVIYDGFGDGICCDFGNGSYTITDHLGNVISQGGAFEDTETKPFEISGGTGEVLNNGDLTSYTGPSGTFCGEISFEPVISVENSGTNDITSMEIEVRAGMTALQNYSWTGSIAPADIGDVTLNTITMTQDTDLTFHIVSVNGETDIYDALNEYGTVSLNLPEVAAEGELTITLNTDCWPEENSWVITDENGVTVASGDNYDDQAETTIVETVNLDPNGCYDFVFTDSYGDGLQGSQWPACETNGNVTVEDAVGNIIYSYDGSYNFEVESSAFETLLTAVNEIEAAEAWNIFPNPAQDIVQLEFTLTKQMPLVVDMYNTLGEKVQTIANQGFGAGTHNLSADVSTLPSGVYYISAVSGNQTTTHKFVVSK